jgi:ornithine cyclodeaminase
MNIPFIDAKTPRATLSYASLVQHLRQAHRKPPPDVHRLPMQQPEDGDDNGFLIWPARQHGSQLGVKLCTLFPQNQQAPTVQALYAWFNGKEGSLQALIDGTEMTSWKTAADSALGADLLARQDVKTLLIVGAGAMAPHMVRAHKAMRPGLSLVVIWNRTPERAYALLADLDGIAAQLAPDLSVAVQNADIVCCVTSNAKALIQGVWRRPGTLVDLIGGYTPQMREADDDVMRRSRVYVDSRWFTVEHVGDLTQPIASGVMSREDFLGDLFDLCCDRVPAHGHPSDIHVFKSGGGAHLDLMTAQHVSALNL